MGEDIIIVNLEIIQGGEILIDFLNKDTNKTERVFCDPDVFWGFITRAMVKKSEQWEKEHG